jgi:hypothetical protein
VDARLKRGLAALEAAADAGAADAALRTLERIVPDVSPRDLDRALEQVRPRLTADVGAAAAAAEAAGLLVEAGADPGRILDHLLAAAEPALAAAGRYQRAIDTAEGVARARQLGDAMGGGRARRAFRVVRRWLGAAPQQEAATVDPEILAALQRRMSGEVEAWGHVRGFVRGLQPALARRPRARAAASEGPLAESVALLASHAAIHPLARLLRVRDGFRIAVLALEAGRGFEIETDGIADNFQLQTLLAAALQGAGPLGGTPPDAAVVEAMRGGSPAPPEAEDHGRWNPCGWRALDDAGVVDEGMDNSAHWIWGEDMPADIEPFEDVPTLILAPLPYERTWSATPAFDGLPAEVRLVAEWPPDVYAERLGRMAAASGPAT